LPGAPLILPAASPSPTLFVTPYPAASVSSTFPHKLEQKTAADPNDLANWREKETEKGTYYYNVVTKVSTWTKPPGYIPLKERLKPVSWEPIGDTEWRVVYTMAGPPYYVNTKTNETRWSLPETLNTPKPKEEKPKESTPINTTSNQSSQLDSSQSTKPTAMSTSTTMTEEDKEKKSQSHDEESARSDEVEENDEVNDSEAALSHSPLPKKRKQGKSNEEEEGPSEVDSDIGSDREPQQHSPKRQKTESTPSFTSHNEETQSSATKSNEDPYASLSYEDRVKIFKEMLREKNVTYTSTWSKMLPVLVYDPRFKALNTQSERQSVFESFVRNRAVEEKKEKRANLKVAQEAFRQLLDENFLKLKHDTTDDDLKLLFGDDPRFKNLEPKERKLILNEKLTPLKKVHQDRVKKAEDEYRTLLEESPIDARSSWTKMKGELAKDPRWQTELLSEKDKERLFRAYVKELANIEKEKKKKREREEAARREREETVRRMKEEQFVKMGRERKKLQRDEEVNNFRALLSERIHDPEARWDEWKRKLASDKRWNAYSLSEHDKERLFEDYIKSIEESREKEFLKCLQSNPKIELNTTWEVAREVLKDELPFKTIANEKWKESIFERHIRDLQQRATDAFLRLLRTLNEKETRLEGPPGKEHLPRSTMDFLRVD
jgi:transcription elongation regulator 1